VHMVLDNVDFHEARCDSPCPHSVSLCHGDFVVPFRFT
jgi:hypothetical protein